jgi:predicted nucleic acid-binding protein
MAKGEIFVDTAFFVGLVNARDFTRQKALRLARELAEKRPSLITTDAVLIEVGNVFSRTPLRRGAIALISQIRADKGWSVLRLEAELVSRGEARYARFRDKNWSMTDCISMEVMQARGIGEIATTDQGFAQAGFKLLL